MSDSYALVVGRFYGDLAARLQAATASDLPILFRSTASAGHGIGSSLKDRIAEQADVLAFLFNQLGVDDSRWAFQ